MSEIIKRRYNNDTMRFNFRKPFSRINENSKFESVSYIICSLCFFYDVFFRSSKTFAEMCSKSLQNKNETHQKLHQTLNLQKLGNVRRVCVFFFTEFETKYSAFGVGVAITGAAGWLSNEYTYSSSGLKVDYWARNAIPSSTSVHGKSSLACRIQISRCEKRVFAFAAHASSNGYVRFQ